MKAALSLCIYNDDDGGGNEVWEVKLYDDNENYVRFDWELMVLTNDYDMVNGLKGKHGGL